MYAAAPPHVLHFTFLFWLLFPFIRLSKIHSSLWNVEFALIAENMVRFGKRKFYSPLSAIHIFTTWSSAELRTCFAQKATSVGYDVCGIKVFRGRSLERKPTVESQIAFSQASRIAKIYAPQSFKFNLLF